MAHHVAPFFLPTLKVLKHNKASGGTKLRALKLLQQLSGASGQLPKSYLVGRWTWYTVRKEIITSGGFADIREGRLGTRAVAVKTLRTSRESKLEEIHKVREAAERPVLVD